MVMMKKRWLSIVGILLIVSIVSASYSVLAKGQVNSPKEYIINQINADNTQPLKLTVNEDLSAVFEVSPANSENQNEFYINVSNVASGLYKVIITATNGYTYESAELNRDITIPSTNIEPDVTYKIFVISTSATPFLADVNITSKIE